METFIREHFIVADEEDRNREDVASVALKEIPASPGSQRLGPPVVPHRNQSAMFQSRRF